jgi:hypothetical protein
MRWTLRFCSKKDISNELYVSPSVISIPNTFWGGGQGVGILLGSLKSTNDYTWCYGKVPMDLMVHWVLWGIPMSFMWFPPWEMQKEKVTMSFT